MGWRPELWLAVIALGAYHGLNPGMGWPLAVSNGMWARREQAVFATFLPLASGHFLAMAVVLLPFALFLAYLDWSQTIRIAAGGIVAAFGAYRLINRRHSRVAARLGPRHLTLWSFLTATAHGAGLMLAPIALGLCSGASGIAPSSAIEGGHEAMSELIRSGIATSIAVSAVHTIAMVAAGATMAWIVYRWAGLKLLRNAWLNLESVWAASLVVTGLVSLAL
jgi:small neutral amino acid transporter SnatA (MarC family)